MSRRSRKSGPPLAAKLHPDDGVDPRTAFSRDARRSSGGRKRMQLCKQVGRAVMLALLDCGDDRLAELTVLNVLPAPDEHQLLVLLQAPRDAVRMPPEEFAALIGPLRGRFRSEVAAAITRKRAPELIFQVC